MESKRGKIIVIEGTDGSGKKTQTDLLIERLNSEGIKVIKLSFPLYETATGRIIGQCYLGKKLKGYWGDRAWFGDPDKLDPLLASLYYIADRRSAKKEIEENLNAGINLILDRYMESNFGHQGGKIKDPKEREEFVKNLKHIEVEHLGIPPADTVLFLHVPTSVSIEMRNNRGQITGEKADGHEGNIQHLKNAEEAYLHIADFLNWKKIACCPDGTINSLKTPEQIHKEIYQIVKEIL